MNKSQYIYVTKLSLLKISYLLNLYKFIHFIILDVFKYYTEIFEENEPGTFMLQITDGRYLIYRCFITINNNRYILNNKSFTSINDLCNKIYTLAYSKLCDDADIKAEKEQEFYNR